jgi:uncharacterized membrane protein YkvA (DUF1232 family)
MAEQKTVRNTFLEKNWLLILAIIYLILPVDLIPDAIPVVGSLDDAALLIINLIQKYILWKREKEQAESRTKGNVKEGEIVE